MQPEVVSYRRARAVGLLLIDYPPVNVLGAAVRAGLARALEMALAEEAVKAIVVACTGKTFSAGADISEFGAPMSEPSLQSVFAAIESAPKPVVAALHGTALGGGLELALACHYRVAVADAKLGLPEITLGVIPGAGGTQRLPRIIGAVAALDLMVAGKPVDAVTAQRLGLIDAVIPGDLLQGAEQYCEQLIAKGMSARPTRDRKVDATGFDHAGIAAVLDKHSKALKGRTTQQLIVEAVTAATRPGFDAGLEVERRLADHSITTTESKALRHLFFAERQVAKLQRQAGDGFGAAGKQMMLDGYRREVESLILEGAAAEQVDAALESFGFSTGPKLPEQPARRGKAQRRIEDAEIIERCLLQLINVGARVLETGVAERAAHIDALSVQGYGFPRHAGGPMFYADSLGLSQVLGRIEHYRARLGNDRWQPAPLLEQLARQSKSLAQWDSERSAT